MEHWLLIRKGQIRFRPAYQFDRAFSLEGLADELDRTQVLVLAVDVRNLPCHMKVCLQSMIEPVFIFIENFLFET